MSSGIRRGPPECVDLPLAQPTPAPRADHSDFSEETLIAYLDRLEGWKPTEEDKDLSKEWIEWLDKSMNFLPKLSPLWIRVLRRLAATCRRSEQLPSSLRIVDHHDVTWLHGDQESTNIDDRKAFTHNGQADIFKCRHEGRAIAVKDYRISSGESMKNFFDEIVLWSRLTHRNIVPFIGRLTAPELALASEWMENGDLISFLEQNPEEDRTSYMRDITSGVNFLHALGVIHADLKGPNVLVDTERRALLADFGISQTSSVTHTQGWWARGTDSYKAPEYQAGDTVATKESDFFALAHLFTELFLPPVPPEARLNEKGKKIKHQDLPEEIKQRCLLYPNTNKSIATQIEQRTRPKRPENPVGPGLTDDLWFAIERCWDDNPKTRWQGWFLFISHLDVPLPEFDQVQAQTYAEKIKKEDAPPPGSIEAIEAEQGIVVHPTWEDWPHTYGKPTPYLVYRHLNPLLDFRRTLPMIPPMIDLSFHQRIFMQEDSINSNVHDEYLKAVPIPEEDLEHGIYAEDQDHEIRYIEIKCALMPGWRAKINEQSLRAGTPRPPSPKTPVFQSVEHFGQLELPKSIDIDQPPKTGFLCGLLPRRLIGGSRISSKSSLSSRKEQEKTSAISDTTSHDTKSRPPSLDPPVPSPGLVAPVPDQEIETLKALTIGDVFTGLWNAMHETLPEEAYTPYTPEQRAKFNKLQFRRAKRAKKLKPREKRALEDAGVIYADLLVDEVMFDGFIVTDVDRRGGMELELLTRAPKEAELNWYRDSQW